MRSIECRRGALKLKPGVLESHQLIDVYTGILGIASGLRVHFRRDI